MKNNIYESAQGILKDDNKLKEFAELNRFIAEAAKQLLERLMEKPEMA
ncbi:hypothetical protein [Photobacterium iliopiscarium]|nr:hypothetical protein [Photobacterium iliopiscarium]